jgi:hypothetical protein
MAVFFSGVDELSRTMGAATKPPPKKNSYYLLVVRRRWMLSLIR